MAFAIRSSLISAAAVVTIAGFALPAAAVQSQSQGSGEPQTQASMTPASVIVFNQKPEGNAVKLTYVYMPRDGYAAIIGANPEGRPAGEPLGTARLSAGDHRDVKVSFQSEPQKGKSYWIALYEESGGDKKFGDSKPIWQMSQLPLANAFKIE